MHVVCVDLTSHVYRESQSDQTGGDVDCMGVSCRSEPAQLDDARTATDVVPGLCVARITAAGDGRQLNAVL